MKSVLAASASGMNLFLKVEPKGEKGVEKVNKRRSSHDMSHIFSLSFLLTQAQSS